MIKKMYLLTMILFQTIVYGQENLDDIIKLLNSGQNDNAINMLKSLGSDNEILFAIAYLEKKDFSNAKSYALKSFSKNSSIVVASYILAQIYEEQKDYLTAIKYWDNVYRNAKDKTVKMLAKKQCEVLKVLTK